MGVVAATAAGRQACCHCLMPVGGRCEAVAVVVVAVVTPGAVLPNNLMMCIGGELIHTAQIITLHPLGPN